MSRSVSIDAMNKISYCLTYHSFLFYISKLLFVTVILYFCIHFHLAPVEGLFFKPKYRANILCICFNFIAVVFLFLSSPWGSVSRFCTVKLNIAFYNCRCCLVVYNKQLLQPLKSVYSQWRPLESVHGSLQTIFTSSLPFRKNTDKM